MLILPLMLCFPYPLDDDRIMTWVTDTASGQEWRKGQARDAHSGSVCWVILLPNRIAVRRSPPFFLGLTRALCPHSSFSSSWYGWSAQARIHWIMPIIGTGIFSFSASLIHQRFAYTVTVLFICLPFVRCDDSYVRPSFSVLYAR